MRDKIQLGLSWLLLLGILLSVALVLCGASLYLAAQGQAPVSYHDFSKMAATYTAIAPVLQGALHFDPAALILLGFLVLVFLQITRVLILAFFFLQSAEYVLAFSSFFIFVVLLCSIVAHT